MSQGSEAIHFPDLPIECQFDPESSGTPEFWPRDFPEEESNEAMLALYHDLQGNKIAVVGVLKEGTCVPHLAFFENAH